jgi:hypothetical protein
MAVGSRIYSLINCQYGSKESPFMLDDDDNGNNDDIIMMIKMMMMIINLNIKTGCKLSPSLKIT